jgi:hypothetical protein
VLRAQSAAIRFGLIPVLVCGAVFTYPLIRPDQAEAGSIQVTTTNNEFQHPGPGAGCSLSEAIHSANSGSNVGGYTGASVGTNTISLAPGATYNLATVDNAQFGRNGLPPITSTIVIEGRGAVIQRAGPFLGEFRFFEISRSGDILASAVPAGEGHLTLRQVTLRNGLARGGCGAGGGAGLGGAMYVRGTLLLEQSTLESNVAVGGSGILISGGPMMAAAPVAAVLVADRPWMASLIRRIWAEPVVN